MKTRSHLIQSAAIRLTFIACVAGYFLALAAPAPAEQIVIYRDHFDVPHIYAETAEGVCYALGYAQATDRLEQILLGYKKAEGTMAESFGPEYWNNDVRSRMWRHMEISREKYATKSPKIRAITEAYIAGIKRYMSEYPEKVPEWAPVIEPAHVSALGRFFMWSWPEGTDGKGDLRRGGIEYNLAPYEYLGSNQWLVAPSRTESGKVIALIDPHLSFYGHMRFYECRLYGGEIEYSGMSVPGLPLPTLGHSRFISIAMTTGGPDTGDIYEDIVNPANAKQYRYGGEWKEMTVEQATIRVKEGDVIKEQPIEFHYTHRGPVVARKGDMAYTMKLSYYDQIYQIDQVYAMITSRNIDQMKEAIAMRQYMAQNIMVGTSEGDIFYIRNGRVPIRPEGFDFKAPVPGYVEATEWKGLHEIDDLVQLLNPPQGYMQNCNVSPGAMTPNSPLTPDKYLDYIYNDPNGPPHQRAAMVLEHLRKADKMTIGQALEIAVSAQVFGATAWIDRLNKAWTRLDIDINDDIDVTIMRAIISDWDGHSRADSKGAMAFKAWKEALPAAAKTGDRYGSPPPDTLTDEECIEALRAAAAKLKADHGSVEVEYGKVYRAGREGGAENWPVGGGNPGSGMATPRAINFKDLGDGTRLGTGGQCATQLVVFTNPPQSWTVAPLGQSDDPASEHFDDSARELFSKRRMKPTYFLDKDAVMENATGKTVLEF